MRAPEKLESGHADAGYALPQRGTGLEGLFACVVLILLLLGSLTPFSFAPDALRRITDGLIWRLGTPNSSPDDIIANFVVYLPVGAALYLCFRKRLNMVWAAGLSVLLASVTSYLIEAAQTLIAGRYASWTDVSVNSIGAGAGVIFAVSATPAIWRAGSSSLRLLRERPFTALSGILVLLLCANSVIPFDHLFDPGRLEESFIAASHNLLTAIMGTASASTASQTALTVENLQAAACFAVLGFLMFAGLLERTLGSRQSLSDVKDGTPLRHYGQSHYRNIVTGIGRAWLIVLMVELMQTASSLHSFELIDLVVNGLAAAIGVTVGFLTCKTRDEQRRVFIPTFVPLAMWLVIMATLVVAPMREIRLPVEISFNSVPMVEYFRLPLGRASGEMAEVVTTYLVLAMLTVLVIGRLLPKTWRAASFGIVILVAASGDLVEAMHPGGHLSGSNTILAAIAAVVVLRLAVLATPPILDQNKVRC